MKNKKLQTQWNLTQLYTSVSDPKIDTDIASLEKAYTAFAKKYKNKTDYLTDESKLFSTLTAYEKLLSIPTSRAIFFLQLSKDLDSGNEKLQAKINLVTEQLQKIGNLVLFFEINLSKITKPNQKKFLASKKLAHFYYFLKKIFDASQFVLTEPEEKILNLKSIPSHSLWTAMVSKIRDVKTVRHNGVDMPLSEASSLVKELPTQKARKDLSDKIMKVYESLGDIASSELSAIAINKKINDELRGYDMPYDSTILSYQNDKKSVLHLVKTVTDNFSVSQRFYALKKKMLGLEKMFYSDRAISVGKTKKKVSFEEAYQILHKVFASTDSVFAEILERLVSNGQVDVYPKVGKKGGAYCCDGYGLPTFVFLNYTDSFDSVQTFAHEMGNAIHTELSKKQDVLYMDYSTSTAEVASTFFETLVFHHQFETLSPTEKIVALHDKIQDDVQTIFRQVACFNFELEMHQTIREKGSMSKEELAVIMNTHMKAYLGSIQLEALDGYFFVGWPHIRTFFYVYSYAFGQLASKALYKKYTEDPAYIEKIKTFLSLGGSMSPEDIFKSVGVDMMKPDFFKKGIESIEDDIALLESLIKK